MGAFQDFPRISPMLWFQANAEEAVAYYLGIFKNARILERLLASEDVPGTPTGGVLTIAFELDGQRFTAINGGANFPFTEAISLMVRCDTQAEVDDYWAKLAAGGSEGVCGWLKDKFGLSWQIVPARLPDLLRHPAAMRAMMGMKKLDIAALEAAAAGSGA